MTTRAVLRGTGHYLPARVVPNDWFAERLDTSDEWIVTRTGIQRRHFVAEGETTSDMALAAAEKALARAGFEVGDLDGIVLATTTPDLTFPATATIVQERLGMRRGFAFDVQAVCAGFVFALANANALIRNGDAKRLLVIGAETFSKLLDFDDRATCVLFGDGAGAVVLEAAEDTDSGILSVDLNTDGRYRDMLYVNGGVSTSGSAGTVQMQGNPLFRQAVEKLAATADAALAKAGLGHDDVDFIVPHQANLRIISATAQKLGVPMERVVVTVQDHGNTSAASIPLALSVGFERGQLKPGQLIVTEAIGGGLAWGAVVIRL